MDFENYIELFNIQKSYGTDLVLKIDYYKIPLDGIVTILDSPEMGKQFIKYIGLLDIPNYYLN